MENLSTVLVQNNLFKSDDDNIEVDYHLLT